jgi:hypothetical protein
VRGNVGARPLKQSSRPRQLLQRLIAIIISGRGLQRLVQSPDVIQSSAQCLCRG